MQSDAQHTYCILRKLYPQPTPTNIVYFKLHWVTTTSSQCVTPDFFRTQCRRIEYYQMLLEAGNNTSQRPAPLFLTFRDDIDVNEEVTNK